MARPAHNKGTRAVVAERRAKAIDLRHAGVDLLTIGRQLRYGRWEDVAPELPADDPARWVPISSDKVIATMAGEDISRGLAERRAGLDRSRAAMKKDMLDRLERLRAAAWGKALQGSVAHMRECANIEAQIARLEGLYSPIRHSIVETPEATAAVASAVKELLSLVPDVPVAPVVQLVKEAG